ncbi:hypothetical protein [Rhizobium sp. 2MFCol3.1]|uniref:hypothetical protein n=1 Tax=Rhizobium sp. 2MFCol3.1 TaxID=1246459 RepID=UPI000366F814|nr:hypothetical protein [Rhizobium sp. 2MFCol3.1]
MALESTQVREHIHRTLETMNRLDMSADISLRQQFSQIMGEQYEALIGLSVVELRQMAAMRGSKQ